MVLLNIYQISQENICPTVIFDKVVGFQPANLLKNSGQCYRSNPLASIISEQCLMATLPL